MRTVELAQCRLSIYPPPVLFDPPQDPEVARVRVMLAHASRVLHAASNHQPTILQDERDTELVYLVTVWPDVEAHTAYTKSPRRQELIDQVKECMNLEWIALFDIQHSNSLAVNATIFAMGRFNVAQEDSEEFEKMHKDVKHELEKFSHHPVTCGWKVKDYVVSDKGDFVENTGDDRKEFITFTGYESVERRMGFPSSDGYARYASIKSYIKWFERRNARVIGIQ